MQEKTRKRVLEKVAYEISENRLWRAKEILRSNISQFYDPYLYERYGQVLESSGDIVEAGKFYFLSGVRKADYQLSIGFFLTRYAKGHINQLLTQFPTQARFPRLDDYPEPISSELKALSFPTLPKRTRHKDQTGDAETSTLGFWETISMLAVLFSLVAAGVGTFVIIRWLIRLLWSSVT